MLSKIFKIFSIMVLAIGFFLAGCGSDSKELSFNGLNNPYKDYLKADIRSRYYLCYMACELLPYEIYSEIQKASRKVENEVWHPLNQKNDIISSGATWTLLDIDKDGNSCCGTSNIYYRGEFSGNTPDGYGEIALKEGNTYKKRFIGHFKKGRQDGVGLDLLMWWPYGSPNVSYIGEYKDGVRKGKGILLCKKDKAMRCKVNDDPFGLMLAQDFYRAQVGEFKGGSSTGKVKTYLLIKGKEPYHFLDYNVKNGFLTDTYEGEFRLYGINGSVIFKGNASDYELNGLESFVLRYYNFPLGYSSMECKLVFGSTESIYRSRY